MMVLLRERRDHIMMLLFSVMMPFPPLSPVGGQATNHLVAVASETHPLLSSLFQFFPLSQPSTRPSSGPKQCNVVRERGQTLPVAVTCAQRRGGVVYVLFFV